MMLSPHPHITKTIELIHLTPPATETMTPPTTTRTPTVTMGTINKAPTTTHMARTPTSMASMAEMRLWPTWMTLTMLIFTKSQRILTTWPLIDMIPGSPRLLHTEDRIKERNLKIFMMSRTVVTASEEALFTAIKYLSLDLNMLPTKENHKVPVARPRNYVLTRSTTHPGSAPPSIKMTFSNTISAQTMLTSAMVGLGLTWARHLMVSHQHWLREYQILTRVRHVVTESKPGVELQSSNQKTVNGDPTWITGTSPTLNSRRSLLKTWILESLWASTWTELI